MRQGLFSILAAVMLGMPVAEACDRTLPLPAQIVSPNTHTQALVTAINATPVGGTLCLPKGVWHITAPVQITKTLVIQGKGAYASELRFAGDGLEVVNAFNGGGTVDTVAEIRDLTLRANGVGIRYTSTRRREGLRVFNARFFTTKDGIVAHRLKRGRIESNDFHRPPEDVLENPMWCGIELVDARDVKIIGNTINGSANQRQGRGMGGVMLLGTSNGTVVSANSISYIRDSVTMGAETFENVVSGNAGFGFANSEGHAIDAGRSNVIDANGFLAHEGDTAHEEEDQ